MVNRSQKEQILKRLEQHYISPLTQFYVEIEVLKRMMLGRPFRVQIGVPDSWRFVNCYQSIKQISQEEALQRLWLFNQYLESSSFSVFAHDKPLVLGDSFPYFEWQNGSDIVGLNQLLGTPHLFYFYKGNEETLTLFCDFIENHRLVKSVVIVGVIPEMLLIEIIEKGFFHIADISKPFLESLSKGRSFTSLFSQSADILLMDQKGRYTKGFSRPEFIRQIDHIKEIYFC